MIPYGYILIYKSHQMYKKMSSHYEELKDISDMPNSIHKVISEYNVRRPPSLSDGCAHNTLNIQRAASFHLRNNIDKPITYVDNEEQKISNECDKNEQIVALENNYIYINHSLRFVCHIAFISIFETIFFFKYVSKLEDGGINNVVMNLVQNMAQSCSNLTSVERLYIHKYILPLINISNIMKQSYSTFQDRQNHNNMLYIRSWIYVGFIGFIFFIGLVGSYLRSIPMNIRNIVLENI